MTDWACDRPTGQDDEPRARDRGSGRSRRSRDVAPAGSKGPGIASRLSLAFAATAFGPSLCLIVWVAVHPGALAGDLVWSGLVLAAVGAVASALIGRSLSLKVDRGLRQLLRAARRLGEGDFPHLVQVELDGDVGELARELEQIGVRLEALQAALDHLEITSGVELGRRSTEAETWRVETVRLQHEAGVLNKFAQAINRTINPAQICNQLVAHSEDTVEYVWAAAYLVDPASKKLVPVFVADRLKKVRQVGHHLRELPDLVDLGERSPAAWAVQSGRVQRVDDRQDNRWRQSLREGLRSMLVVPLTARDETLGVVEFGHVKSGAYSDQEERFLTTLAGQAGIAIENARLLEEAAKVEALRELDRLKSELLSTVSHELRTPLVSIKGYAETLLRQDVVWSEEDRREFLQYIDEESDHLRALIEDLLQMSQIEAGRLSIARQALPIGRLAQRVVRRARVRASGHTISASFPGDLPAVDADPKRVEQVLTNLIQNAIKYSPDGGAIRVRGLAATARTDGRYDFSGHGPTHVVVAVADEGAGIPSEHVHRIFDRFYRVEGELAIRAGGSGLGLAICRGIVEAHGGHIWVESPGVVFRAGEDGKGTTFYFSLPAWMGPAEDLEDDLEEELVTSREGHG